MSKKNGKNNLMRFSARDLRCEKEKYISLFFIKPNKYSQRNVQNFINVQFSFHKDNLRTFC